MIRLLWALLAALLWTAPATAAEAKVGDDGLHVQDWFITSLLDLRDDLKEAAAAGKRLAVVWEQKGCPYCRDMHAVNLADAKITGYIRERYHVLQLNMFGDREVTDFDGKVLSEKELARRWKVIFTPTILFFPDTPEAAAGKPGHEIEVARMPGYFRPFHFLSMFEYVYDKRYARDQDFQRYIHEKAAAAAAAGTRIE